LRTSRFYFGQIVWASVFDGRHKTKVRRVVIFDEDLNYDVTGEILIVPFSTSENVPCPYYHVEVNGSDPETKCQSLPDRCWAKIDGAEYIGVDRIREHAGVVPDSLLLLIKGAFARALEDPDFKWWS
jgi:uncharacterized protein YifN (PemK superfamily)